MKQMELKRVGIWYIHDKSEVFDAARRIVDELLLQGIQPVVEQRLANALEISDQYVGEFDGCAFLCVLGGDGTLLAALDITINKSIPILGINLGRVGFLSELAPEDIETGLRRVLAGEGYIDRRMMLKACTEDGLSGLALNDVAFNRSEASVGILHIELMAGPILVERLAGDGLVVASATGSTAYSMAAGGPVVVPGLDCMVITPICPQTLHMRPAVVSAEDVITVRVIEKRSQAHIMLDGYKHLPLSDGASIVTIRRAEVTADFLRLDKCNFYDLMRRKLSLWSS